MKQLTEQQKEFFKALKEYIKTEVFHDEHNYGEERRLEESIANLLTEDMTLTVVMKQVTKDE